MLASRARGRLGEAVREIGHHENAKRLGHFAGEFVVVDDRLEIVAQIFLDDDFHLLGEIDQAGFDVGPLGPNAIGDEDVVEIGEVHEAGEILAAADRIDDREPHFAWRNRGQ